MDIQRQKQIQEQYRLQIINQQKRQIEELHPELLIPGDLLFITLKINGVEVPAMLDTGAMESIIPYHLCEQCNLTNQIDYQMKKSYQGVGTMESIGTIYVVPITIGKTQYVTTLNVFNEKSPLSHIIIGINTMRSLRITIDLKRNGIVIDDEFVGFMSNTDVDYVCHKPFDIPPLTTPLNINQRRRITSQKKPEFKQGEYNRYDDCIIEKLSVLGLNREDAMNMLDANNGNVESVIMKISGESLFNSM